MVDRIERTHRVSTRGKSGGRRPGAGRRLGSVNEAKKVARARALREDLLPHELLLVWARTGRMRYPRGRVEELEPSDRIACAKGCASWFKPPLQPQRAPGEQPPVVRVELDARMIASITRDSPDRLELLREVLIAVGAGDSMITLAQSEGTDPGRYAMMLQESSDVGGSA